MWRGRGPVGSIGGGGVLGTKTSGRVGGLRYSERWEGLGLEIEEVGFVLASRGCDSGFRKMWRLVSHVNDSNESVKYPG